MKTVNPSGTLPIFSLLQKVRDVNIQNTSHSLPPSDSMGNTLTEQQIEYFKDSKVVGEKGRLLVVYHGTFADYSVFDINKTSNTNYWGKGWYFTNSEIDAKNNYASNKAQMFLQE